MIIGPICAHIAIVDTDVEGIAAMAAVVVDTIVAVTGKGIARIFVTG